MSDEYRETPDERFLHFVQDQIEKLKEYSQLGSDTEISYFSLNRALMQYEGILLTLLGLYNMARIDTQSNKEAFKEWFAEKFCAIRTRENRPELSAQKWMSQKEIEYMLQSENKEQYRMFKRLENETENKEYFLKGLVEAWQSQQFILSTLSKNVQSESAASYTEGKMH